jgi:hypothetical protein
MQIEVAYVSALHGEREDRPEDDEGNTGCDGHDASPFLRLDRELGDELSGVTRGGRHGCGLTLGACCSIAADQASGTSKSWTTCSLCSCRAAPRPRTIHAMMPITGLLCCDELMAGLVPDRGRGSGLVVASRYLAVLLVTFQLSRKIPPRKEPETANVITQTDY